MHRRRNRQWTRRARPVASPGATTSEFKLTVVVMALGACLDGVSVALDAVQANHLVDPNAHWFAIALAVLGTTMTLVKALGYTRSRTMVKVAELAGPAASGVASGVIPLLQAELQLLREQVATLKGQPLPASPLSPALAAAVAQTPR